MTPLPPSAFFEVDTLFRQPIEAWINHGTLPEGSKFLQAALAGDMKHMVKVAAQHELSRLPTLLRFLERVAPDCWGSTNAMGEWLHSGGMTGKARVVGEYERTVVGKRRRRAEGEP